MGDFDPTKRQLRRIRDDLTRSGEDIVASSLSPVVRRAREILAENGHVRTGRLRDSIEGSSERSGPATFQGVAGSDVDYASDIEALPDGGFLHRASEEATPEMVRSAGVEIERVIRRAAR